MARKNILCCDCDELFDVDETLGVPFDNKDRVNRGQVVFSGRFSEAERRIISHYYDEINANYGFDDGPMGCSGNVVTNMPMGIPVNRLVDIGDNLSVIRMNRLQPGVTRSVQEFARCVLMSINLMTNAHPGFPWEWKTKEVSGQEFLEIAHETVEFSLDIETTGLDPNFCRVVSIGISNGEIAHVVYNRTDESGLIKIMSKLADKRYKVAVAGGTFEQKWWWAKTSKVLRLVEDVQVNEALLNESGHKGLEYIACHVGYAGYDKTMEDWKEPVDSSGKRLQYRGTLAYRDIYRSPKEILIPYNGLDCIVTAKASIHGTRKLMSEPSDKIMDHKKWMVRGQTCLGITEQTGFKVDPAKFIEVKSMMSQRVSKATSFLKDKMIELGMSDNVKILNPKNKLALLRHHGIMCESTDKNELKDILKSGRVSGEAEEILKTIVQVSSDSSIMSNVVNAAEKALAGDGYVRTSFSLTKLLTGQISSVDPPMMNVAKSPVRRMFVSRFLNGVILDVDYSQLHMRIIGNATNCAGFISAYKDGVDLHSRTGASVIMKIDEGAFLERLENGDTKCIKARDLGKRLNFSVIFEITPEGLAASTGLNVKYCAEIIRGFYSVYPEIKAGIVREHNKAMMNGCVVSVTGRVRHLPAAKMATKSFVDRVAKDKALRQAGDYLVSNPGRSITMYGMTMMQEKLIKRGMKSRVVLQMHDSIVHDVHPDEEAEVLKMARQCYIDNIHKEFPTITSPVGLEMDGYINSCWWKDGRERSVSL